MSDEAFYIKFVMGKITVDGKYQQNVNIKMIS